MEDFVERCARDHGITTDELKARWTERARQEAAEREQIDAKTRAKLEAEKPGRWRKALLAAAPVQGAEEVFGELRETDAVKAVRSWLATDQSRGLCIRGPVGCGKTLAALCAVKAWVEPTIGIDTDDLSGRPRMYAGHDVSWLRPDELVSATIHRYEKTAPKLQSHVVVDDLGRETKLQIGEALCQLFERRDRVLLITTNLTRAQMRERYEPRVLSRLGHHCQAVDVRGPDLRLDGGF